MSPASRKAYVKAVDKMVREGTFIRMDADLKHELQLRAEDDGRTLSGLIHKVLSDWLKSQRERK